MRASDLNPPRTEMQFAKHRTARLEHRQVECPGERKVQVSPYKQCIAVPAETAPPLGHRESMPAGIVKQRARNNAWPLAEPQIGLLQGDNVGIDLAQNRDDAFGVAAPIKPDTLVNVVGRDLELD